MSLRPNGTWVDPNRCMGCGLCVRVCPAGTLTLVQGKSVSTGLHSLGCDQCAAVCPEGAITVAFPDDEALRLASLPEEPAWVPYGQADLAGLVALLRSRRSCRAFLDREVPMAVLEDLVKIAIMAPSGHNTQTWQFTIVPDRPSVMALGQEVARFFRGLNRLAEQRGARLLARVFKDDVLGRYYRSHYESVREGLRQWDELGRDRLFHGAPAAIVVSLRPDEDNGGKDTLMATQNMLLAAHAMGYATCLIGFAVNAMAHDRGIQTRIGIPEDEEVMAVVAVGQTDIIYQRPTRRRAVRPRVFSVKNPGTAGGATHTGGLT